MSSSALCSGSMFHLYTWCVFFFKPKTGSVASWLLWHCADVTLADALLFGQGGPPPDRLPPPFEVALAEALGGGPLTRGRSERSHGKRDGHIKLQRDGSWWVSVLLTQREKDHRDGTKAFLSSQITDPRIDFPRSKLDRSSLQVFPKHRMLWHPILAGEKSFCRNF